MQGDGHRTVPEMDRSGGRVHSREKGADTELSTARKTTPLSVTHEDALVNGTGVAC